MNKNVMLVSPDTVKGYGILDYNFDDSMMGDAIRKAQNVYLREVIGDRLLERLQELVMNKIEGNEDNIDSEENEQYKVLLKEYVEEALARKASVILCMSNSFKMKNLGIAQTYDSNIKAATLSDIKYIRDDNETYWNDMLNRMMDYLKQNKDAFPELSDCPCSPPILNNRYANTKLFLG